MKTGKNGKNEVNTGPQRAQETQWPVNEPFTTAPLPHKNKLLLLLPRRIASRLVYFFSLTINLPIILVRSHSWLWRWAAKLYIFPWDRFAYLNACLVCALSRITVPAYRTFVKSRSHRFWQVFLESYPETNKENYVKKFDFASQCRHGIIKIKGTTIDESSGSSGAPFNWLRSASELRDIHRNIANYIRLEFPSEKLITLNAFSMGAWATGLNVSHALTKVGIVKSIGPDVGCILATLNKFGPGFDYLITAYPPFLKRLCDQMDASNFPWGLYTLYGMVGGEGMTEVLRDYLERRFKKVRSAYGATDLPLGIGCEMDLTVALRREIITNSALRYQLLGEGEDRFPMIFQYNPLENYIEINKRSEVVVTVNNLSVMCPKARYNLGDEGKVMSFSDMIATLDEYVPWRSAFPGFRKDLIRLPVLFLFGRKDTTISYMGANIYPQDVEYGLYKVEAYAQSIESFCLSLGETADLNSFPKVNIQLQPYCQLSQEEIAQIQSLTATTMELQDDDGAALTCARA